MAVARAKYFVLEEAFSDLLEQVRDGELNMRLKKNINKVDKMGAKYNVGFSKYGPGPNFQSNMVNYLSWTSIVNHLPEKQAHSIFKKWFEYHDRMLQHQQEAQQKEAAINEVEKYEQQKS